MTNPEMILQWIIAHRGEPIVEIYLCEQSQKLDAEIVEETLCHVWAGFYDAEPVRNIAERQIVKNCYAVKRNRRIEENRRHYAELCKKRGGRT